jgi:hypothetical protein
MKHVMTMLLVLAAQAFGPVARADDMPTYSIVIRAGRFEPATLEVPANTRFRLSIKNEGPGAEEFESTELRKEKVLAPGASSFLVFQPLKPGSYRFFGEFHPDTAQGRIVAK